MYCGSNKTKKKGKQLGRQRYLCLSCGKQFQNKIRKEKLSRVIWNKFVWHRQTISQLSKEYKKSPNWVREHLNRVQVKIKSVSPQEAVLILDATFFKRIFGVLVVRAPHLKRNIYWKEIVSETINEYFQTRVKIEDMGFKIKAVVTDGRPGVRNLFLDVPVQMCHFHQRQIINRYLTLNPKLEASIELKSIASGLCHTGKEKFVHILDLWHEKWADFLKERTINPDNHKRWFYTHKRVRSAYRSLNGNLPYLFTYKDYPELDIPNTTNSLDGYFAHLKELTRIHRGAKRELKSKIINEILAKIDPRI